MIDNDKLILSIWKFLESRNLLCLFHWYKEVMKQPIKLVDLEAIKNVLEKLNLKYVLSDFFYENIDENCIWKDTNKIIYISSDINKANLVKEYDECFEWEFYVNHKLSTKYKFDEATIWNWKLLGYPNCCVESFINTDNYDSKLFYAFSDKAKNYLKCHNYLNVLEYIILYHIPCSFDCSKSIFLWEKTINYYLDSYSPSIRDYLIENIHAEKTYILFKSLNWIKIQSWKYYYGSYILKEDKIFNNIKSLIDEHWFKIDIINAKEVKIYNNIKKIIVKDIQVLHFPKINYDMNI